MNRRKVSYWDHKYLLRSPNISHGLGFSKTRLLIFGVGSLQCGGKSVKGAALVKGGPPRAGLYMQSSRRTKISLSRYIVTITDKKRFNNSHWILWLDQKNAEDRKSSQAID